MSSDLGKNRSKVSDDDDDDHGAVKPVLLADQVMSDSAHRFRKRADKVWTVSTSKEEKEEEDKSQEKVGDIVHLDGSNYFIIDIFENEIMELGDKIDLNFKRFKKFESVYGDAPRDHHFYNNRCCYSSCCCVCGSNNVEKEWRILKKELTSRDSRGVSFFVRTYEKRKELMRIAATRDGPGLKLAPNLIGSALAATLRYGGQSYNLFFFDLKFPTEYPYEAPSFFYHPYGLPLSASETPKLRPKLSYNIFDVILHIEEIVLMNNKSYQQMLDMMKRPLIGFEDFVRGHFRTKAPFILRKMMEEMDMDKEMDQRNMFWKMYIAFENNKACCKHILNNDLKEELKRIKEKENSLSEHLYTSSSTYLPTMMSRFDDIQKTSNKYQNVWSKLSSFYSL